MARHRPPVARRPSRWILSLAFATGCVTGVGSPSSACAEESAFCRRARARAAADASLLFAPTVIAQGIKFPTVGSTDAGVTVGTGYQFRAGLSVSPLDIYKGLRVVSTGEAECEQHEARTEAATLLTSGEDAARLPALEREAEYLDAQRHLEDEILSTTDERVSAKLISLLEQNEVLRRSAALARERARIAGQRRALEVRGVRPFRGNVTSVVNVVELRTMRYERQAAHVRSLAPWHFTVMGGVVPHLAPVDFFGVVQLGVNLGTFSRNANETSYLEAREEEVKAARYEIPAQLRALTRQAQSSAQAAERELASVEKEAAALTASRAALEKSDASHAPHARAIVVLDLILVEARRTYLTEFIREARYLTGEKNGN